tara:strand:+ start:1172 stop:1585 length:414 start_codon:yes stop_codon:yes gene_type:complete
MDSLDKIIKHCFTKDEIAIYKRIRSLQQNVGRGLENYIRDNFLSEDEGLIFVGRDKNRPEGVDFIIDGVEWSVKNAWNTDNHSMKKYREDRNINHWYRLNRDGSTNWETLFVRGLSESGFLEYMTGEEQASLERFFG